MVDPRWKNPYSGQYNFGVEQQLTRKTILELNYVGSASHRMDVGGYYNTGAPCGYPSPYASFSKRDRPALPLDRTGKVVGPCSSERLVQRSAGNVSRQLSGTDLHDLLHLEQDSG
jgi:hypothetical protein